MTLAETSQGPRLSISIVSHGQGRLIRPLLEDLWRLKWSGLELLLTINIPEDEAPYQGLDLPMVVIRNESPKGFGANHNAAFRRSGADIFAVVNPDIRLPRFELDLLLERLSDARVGACAPLVVADSGQIQDNARRFPTLPILLRRVLLGERAPDYPLDRGPLSVDWVAGMFVVFRRDAFEQVKGFDEKRFFMYYEDVDICKRLHGAGWNVVFDPTTEVVHNAQRTSHSSAKYLRWHLTSAARYLTGL